MERPVPIKYYSLDFPFGEAGVKSRLFCIIPVMKVTFEKNCPINEETGDGIPVGRCWFYMDDGKTCPRHGDVSIAVDLYKKTGKLMRERDFIQYERDNSK